MRFSDKAICESLSALELIFVDHQISLILFLFFSIFICAVKSSFSNHSLNCYSRKRTCTSLVGQFPVSQNNKYTLKGMVVSEALYM